MWKVTSGSPSPPVISTPVGEHRPERQGRGIADTRYKRCAPLRLANALVISNACLRVLFRWESLSDSIRASSNGAPPAWPGAQGCQRRRRGIWTVASSSSTTGALGRFSNAVRMFLAPLPAKSEQVFVVLLEHVAGAAGERVGAVDVVFHRRADRRVAAHRRVHGHERALSPPHPASYAD